jgi:hypothetical protein
MIGFFSVILLVAFVVDILIVFFLNMDLSDLFIVFLVTGMFLLLFSTYYISKKIRRRGLSDCDLERETDNNVVIGSIMIFSFTMICLFLFGGFFLFYRNEILHQRDDAVYLNSKYQERSNLLALYIKSKLNDNEKSAFKRNYFGDELYFYNKFGGSICLLSINSSICKYWLDRVVDEVKQQTADQTEEKASYLNKVEQEKQVLEKFKENNNLPASIKN